MRQSVLKLYLLTMLSVVMIISSSYAILLPPGLGPSLDIAADATGGVEAGGNVAANIPEKIQQQYVKIRDKVKKFTADVEEKVVGAIEKAEGKVAELKENINGKINKLVGALHQKNEGDSTVSTSREIQESKIADIHNEEDVMQAFYTLFGEYPKEFLEKYPQDIKGVKRAYKDKGVEFSNDSLIELYITSRDMEEMMSVIDKDVSTMSEKYVTGTTVAADPEIEGENGEANDELNSWVNFYKVVSIYDSVLRVTEELSALDAQYEAGRALKKGIEPIDPMAESEKTSSNEISVGIVAKSAYAQAGEVPSGFKKVDLSEVQKAAGGVVEVKPEVAQSAFKGAGDQFADLVSVNDVSFVLKEAMDVHNLKQQLSTFKEPFIEYNRMKKLHTDVIEQVKNSEECAISYLGRYYNDPTSAWLGKGCKYTNDLNLFCDTGVKVTKESLRTLAKGDTLCKNDKTKICSTYGLNRYERRGGLSGWLLSAYKIAKAEKTLEFSADDYATQLNDADISETSSLTKLEEMEEMETELVASQENNIEDSALIKPTDELKMAQNDRERDILAWQMGALMAKKIGAEMSKGDDSVYGTFKNKYPLWADEKYFYEQYLKNKYSNMQVFVQSSDMRTSTLSLARKISNNLYVEETEEEKEAEDYEGAKMHGVLFESVLDYNNKGFDALEEQIKQVASAKVDKAQKVQEKLDSETQKIKSEYAQQTQNLQTQIKNIYEQLDELNVELNDAKLKYNEAKDNQIQADSQANAEGVILDLAEKRSEKSENVDTSNFEASANQAKQEAENAAVKAEQRRKETLAEVESLRMQIDDLKDRLEKTKEQLKQTKSASIEAVALKEYENEIALNKAYEEIKNVKASKIGSLLNITGTIKDSIFRNIIFVSEKAEEIVRENALSAIREAYAAIEALEDDRFNPEKYSKIVNIHKQMLDKIKNPSFGLSGHLNYLSGHIELAVIEQLAIEEMAKVLFNKICKSNVCYQSDEQYYIGATPNEKDFVAPKAITKSYTPPLREIVHFDGTDYDNLDISNNSVITKDSLLNVGAMLSTSCEGDAKDYFCQDGDTAQTIVYNEFVPEIWGLILGPKGFVERDVPILPLIENLSHPILFEDMAAKDQLMRGGLYPCSVGEYAIDIKNGQYVGTQNDEYPKCQHIKNVKKYSKLTIENGGLKNVTFLDLTFGEDEVVTAKFNTGNDEDKSASELALFAKSQDKMMRFNKSLEKAAQYLAELDDDYDKNQKRLYDNMMLDKNQFGDYLKFVERELEFQKSLDQLKVKVDEAREKLREEFAKYGYTLPDEFDLSDDETYKDFAAKLNEAKDERVSKADTKLLSLVGKNDMLKERIAKTKNTMSLLKLDNDELINLSDMLSLDEVEKRIKTAKADNDTKGEYDKEVAKSYDNNSKGETIPYCAVY